MDDRTAQAALERPTFATWWSLDRIKPYPKNARSHPQDQIKLLARMLEKYGPDQPIVVDENCVILKGHGRKLAAELAGMISFPVHQRVGLSDDDKQAIRIADNQVALLSGWDDDMLKSELDLLRAHGFDMSELGFPDKELAEIFAQQPAPVEDRALTPHEQNTLNRAWRVLLKDWQQIAQLADQSGFYSTNFTRGALQVYFMRAWLYGDDIPRAATTAYNPHRISQAGSHGKPYLDLLKLALEKDNVLNSLQWFCGGKPNFDQMIGVTLGIQDHRPPADFPPLLARNLINEFCVKQGAVLDPCHGWGGRMLGFMLSHANIYEGFDTDARTVAGVGAMFKDLSRLRPGKTANLHNKPFEDAKLKTRGFDFALTSPPYYDTERYGGAQSSWKRYKNFDAWVNGFYRPLIEQTSRALVMGGTFALQIGNQSYPLEEKAREIAPLCGMKVLEKRTTDMVNNYMGTDPSDGEIVLLLRKGEK